MTKSKPICGYLQKYTNFVQGYKYRWFVLSNGVLSYYKNEAETSYSCRGSISLTNAEIIATSASSLTITNVNGQVFHIRAPDEKIGQTWLLALQEARKTKQTDDDESELCSIRAMKADLLQTMKDIEEQAKELQCSREILPRQWNLVKDSLSEIQNLQLGLNSDLTKQLEERVTIFRVTCSALINRISKFNDLVQTNWYKFVRHMEMQHLQQQRLQTMIERLAKDQIKLEKRLRDYPDKKESILDDADSEDEDLYFDASHTTFDPNQKIEVYLCQGEGNSPKPGPSRKRDHRTRIPKKPQKSFRLWAILKQFVGTDITRISMPVDVAEPLSMLQRLTEEFEYAEVLDKAAECATSAEQMGYVAAFIASNYCSSAVRNNKPFNALLGETFEMDRLSELGWRSFTEQVSHHPPVVAQHCEGQTWTLWRTFSMSSKFRGNYITIVPEGETHLTFNASMNHYTWVRPTTTIHNIIVGKIWVDHYGDISIINHTTNEECKLTFKQSGYFSNEYQRKVSGIIQNRFGESLWKIHGKWNRLMQLSHTRRSSQPSTECFELGQTTTIWEANPPNPGSEDFYNFSEFACQLNEPDEMVAPTDSRRRPDQRLMEDGRWEEANEVKILLEEKQRAKLRERTAEGEHYSPTWFNTTKTDDGIKFEFNKKYWECKQKQDWSKCPNIF